ncbi:MAG: hypothetical protein R3C14_31920 [Caldilineaceae bacterium]
MANVPLPAIIIGLDSLPGIQLARLLAWQGVPVIALARRPTHYCCKTNVCRQILFADTQSADFVETLLHLAPTLPAKAVLFPCTDMSVWHLAQQRQRLAAHYHIPLPPTTVIEQLLDKVAFYTFAQEQGLPIPRTSILTNHQEAVVAAATLTFPCVLKPPKRTPQWTAHTDQKGFRLNSPAELLTCYARCAAWAKPLLVQEWVVGPESNLYSFNGYFNHAEQPLVTFVARKLRQWPPETGNSCLGEEYRNDEVLMTALRLFTSVPYHGFAYLEMKQDARTGQHFLLEANIGRPTVRSAIAENGGVALHYAAYCDVTGAPLPKNLQQRYAGAKWVHLHYDTRAAWRQWRRGALTLGNWLHSLRGIRRDALFAWRDPLPFWWDLVTTLKRSIHKVE